MKAVRSRRLMYPTLCVCKKSTLQPDGESWTLTDWPACRPCFCHFRVISCEEGKALAESWNAAFMESSAKENQVWFEAEAGFSYLHYLPGNAWNQRGVPNCVPLYWVHKVHKLHSQMPYWWNRRSGQMASVCSVSDSELTYPSVRRHILIKHDGLCVW